MNVLRAAVYVLFKFLEKGAAFRPLLNGGLKCLKVRRANMTNIQMLYL